MPEVFDLHCHSTFSDGTLSPTELVNRAQAQGVTALSLTDHDTTASYKEAQAAATACNIRLIAGIELSVSWQDKTFHIVGLNINPYYPPLLEASRHLQHIRLERAKIIADKLEKKRIPGALEYVINAAGDSMITRTHFADFLVSQFHVTNHQEAFDRYLAKGKPAFVATVWAEMELAINWITQSGGIAVLAHPLRYNLPTKWMNRFLSAFVEAGGQGIEVITSRCSPDEIKLAASYANIFGLVGSVGSDFHCPGNQWVELGRLAPLPDKITPVWELFG